MLERLLVRKVNSLHLVLLDSKGSHYAPGKRSLKHLRRLLKHGKSQKQTAHGFSFVSPASLARIIASARPATCSLLKMEETWLRTVLGLSTRCSAMAGLV